MCGKILGDTVLVGDTDETCREVSGMAGPSTALLSLLGAIHGQLCSVLGNRVIYQGSAAHWADTMQLFVHSSTVKRKQPWQELALAGMLGWGRQSDSSAGETQFVGALAIYIHPQQGTEMLG